MGMLVHLSQTGQTRFLLGGGATLPHSEKITICLHVELNVMDLLDGCYHSQLQGFLPVLTLECLLRAPALLLLSYLNFPSSSIFGNCGRCLSTFVRRPFCFFRCTTHRTEPCPSTLHPSDPFTLYNRNRDFEKKSVIISRRSKNAGYVYSNLNHSLPPPQISPSQTHTKSDQAPQPYAHFDIRPHPPLLIKSHNVKPRPQRHRPLRHPRRRSPRHHWGRRLPLLHRGRCHERVSGNTRPSVDTYAAGEDAESDVGGERGEEGLTEVDKILVIGWGREGR